MLDETRVPVILLICKCLALRGLLPKEKEKSRQCRTNNTSLEQGVHSAAFFSTGELQELTIKLQNRV